MRRITIVILVVLLAAVGVVIFLAFPRSGGDWRQIRASFTGITNWPGGGYAAISVSSDGDRAVTLRDSFEIEYVGIPPNTPVAGPGGAGISNLIRLVPTGTNLVIDGSRKADFLIPIPTDGDTWIARLEFAPAGLKTKVGEHLIRRHERWATSLPLGIRGIPTHFVSQSFTTTGAANKTVQRTGASRSAQETNRTSSAAGSRLSTSVDFLVWNCSRYLSRAKRRFAMICIGGPSTRMARLAVF
jgi:hypothetical protein